MTSLRKNRGGSPSSLSISSTAIVGHEHAAPRSERHTDHLWATLHSSVGPRDAPRCQLDQGPGRQDPGLPLPLHLLGLNRLAPGIVRRSYEWASCFVLLHQDDLPVGVATSC
jgi:hypothetical protein